MLSRTILATMLDYNAAMDERLLTLAASLSDEQLDAASSYSRGSLRQTLVHIVQVEYMWRVLCESRGAPFTPPAFPATPTISELQAFAKTEGQRARAFIDRLSDEELTAPFSAERRGKTYQFVPWQVLVHLLYHSGQHRSEAGERLTSYGQSPGDIDFMYFVNPQQRPPGG